MNRALSGDLAFAGSLHVVRIAEHAIPIAADVIPLVEGKIIRHRVKDYSRGPEPS